MANVLCRKEKKEIIVDQVVPVNHGESHSIADQNQEDQVDFGDFSLLNVVLLTEKRDVGF